MLLLFYTTYISVDLEHHKIFCAKVGKRGINVNKETFHCAHQDTFNEG